MGRACRSSSARWKKSYTGTIRFGFATDTYDAEGQQVGDHQQIDLDAKDLAERVAAFIGETQQMPPAFSAKKIAGKSAHTLARAGKPVDLKAVPVTVHHFAIAKVSDECAAFEVKISAGGYIRSLAHDLGQQLGCGAHLASLRRTAAGPFTLVQSLTLEQLADAAANETLAQHLPHPRTILPAIPATTTDAVTAGRIRNGSAVNLPEYSDADLVKIFEGRDHLLGIGKRIAGTLFQPIVVLG